MSLHGDLILYPPPFCNEHVAGDCLLPCSKCVRVILRFPLPVRSVVPVCLYQSVEGSLQVLRIHRSVLRSRQWRVTKTVTVGGPQGRGVLGPRLRQLHDDEYALDKAELEFEIPHLGDDKPPRGIFFSKHSKEAPRYTDDVWITAPNRWWLSLQDPSAMQLGLILYFHLEPKLNNPVISSDCGSNMSTITENDEL